MSRFFLAPFVGTGTAEDPYRPPVDGDFGIFDFRPDPRVVDGRCLLRTPVPLSTLPRGVVELGDLDESMPRTVSSALENALGVTLDFTDNLRGIVAELLLLHGDERELGTRTRWRRLKQNSQGRHRIVIGGEVVYDAPAVVGATITESFDQADSTTLGPDQPWTETRNDLKTVSNRVRLNVSLGNAASARAEADLAGSDHYAQVDVWLDESLGDIAVGGPMVRFSSSAETAYVGYVADDDNTSDNQLSRLLKVVSGLTTVLQTTGSRGAGWWTDGDTLRLTVDGSGLTLEGPVGTTLETLTDTSIASGTRAGIWVQTQSGGVEASQEIDNFEAADLAGGTTFTQSMTGSLTPVGVLTRQTQKPLAGSVTPAGTTTKQAQKTLTGTVSAAGVLTRHTLKTLTGQILPTGALVKLAAKTFTGSVTGTGALATIKVVLISLAGSITATGTLVKQTAKTLTGNISPSGTLIRQTQKAFTGSSTGIGTLVKQANKILAGSSTPSGTLETIKVILISLAGSITPSGALTKQVAKNFSGTVTAIGLVAKTISKSFAGSITATSTTVIEKIGEVLLDTVRRKRVYRERVDGRMYNDD